MNKSNIPLNDIKLKEIAYSSSTAEFTMTALALRERDRANTNLKRTKKWLMQEGGKIIDSDFINLFQALEKEGIGKLIHDHKGRPVDFQWHCSLKKVAKKALEGKTLKLKKVTPVLINKRETAVPNIADREVLVSVRPGLYARICMPRDLTSRELDTLVNALKQVS